MAVGASNTLTFDDDPPHRASLDELGGGAKENNAAFPPDPVRHPTAEEFNQFGRQLEALNRVMPLAVLWVRINAGTPSIVTVQAVGSGVSVSSFTVTDVGVGETRITWKTGAGQPAGALPPAVGVKASQTDDTEIDRIRAILGSFGGDPAATVKTKLGAAATDCNFCLEIF